MEATFIHGWVYEEKDALEKIQDFEKISKKPFQIYIEDHIHVRGRMGLYTNGAKKAAFDRIALYPIKCILA